ncbi:hypothetical protein GF327_05600 [Candidatus Woesearchaeota archaeon]|nr:hypothetical protein [Candidatus Woesearchaeota archaeon]
MYEVDSSIVKRCILPREKAVVNLDILENDEDSFRLNLKIKTQSDYFNLNKNSIIIGDKSVWTLFFDKKRRKYVIIELDTKYPRLLMNIVKLDDMILNKDMLHYIVDNYYLMLSEIGNISLPEIYEIEQKTAEPKPRIYLKDYKNIFSIDLKFLYGNSEVLFNSHKDVVVQNKKNKIIKIKRDKNKEKEYLDILLNNHVFYNDEFLVPSINPYEWLSDVSKALIEKGYEIFGEDNLFNQKLNKNDPELVINVSSGIDWFDLKADVSFGENNVSFEKILDSLADNQRFIKLSDGTTGVIPKKWLNKLSGVSGLLNYSDKKVKASKSQIQIVDALLGLATEAKTDQKFKKIKEKFRNFKEIKKVDLPKKLKCNLRQYQKAGYHWLHFLKEFSFGGCLADDMGLGKTVQVLSILLYEKEKGNNKSSLVVVPRSLIFNWVDEVDKFTPSLNIHVHHGNFRNKKKLPNKDIILTTYGTLRRDKKLFSKKKFYYIVLDESQKIKNPRAKITKTVFSLKSDYRLVLTGTPIENNSLELWSQFSFLNPGLLGKMDYFKNTFSKKIEKDKDKEKIKSLKNMINPFLLSRKKDLVAKDLPEKQITTLYCEMTPKQRKVYDSWKEKYRNEIKKTIKEKGFLKSRMKVLEGLTRLRQISNHPLLIDESYTGKSGKFETLTEHIKEVISSGHKVLLFSSFVKMLKVFKKYFDEKNIKYSYLDGSTRKRKNVVEKFQNNSKIRIFLISIKAGGLGLNLTAADYVYIVDPWWNPAVEMQAIDRTHRIGQDKKVFVYKTITKDSVEEKILELQESKLDLVKNIITIEQEIFKNLTQKDIQNIFI